MCKDRTLFHMAYVAYIFLTLVSVCISGNEYKHYGMILVPVLIYPISMLLSKKVIKEKHWILAFMLCMVITYTIPSWIFGLNKMAEYCFQEEKTKTRSDTTGKIVQYVVTNSDENDKIIVWGNWNIVYVLSKRLPASKYSYQFPIGKVDRQILIEFFEELEITLPKFVIIAEEIGDMEKFLNNNNYFCANEIDGRKIYKRE